MTEQEKQIKNYHESIALLEEYNTMIGTAISCLKGEVIIPEEDGTVATSIDFGHINIKQLKEKKDD